MKSGSLNLLEPSGPVQACNGIAFTINLVSMKGKYDLLEKNLCLIYSRLWKTQSFSEAYMRSKFVLSYFC